MVVSMLCAYRCGTPCTGDNPLNLSNLLLRIARMDPDRPAIFNGTQRVASHAQWAERCARLAGHFQAAGLQPGDRVALFMRNHPRYLEVLCGAWWAGLVV